jgi:transcriptional regulator with XRE-family HTH domain
MSASKEEAASKHTGLPAHTVTINQLVGHNMALYREAAGLTQEQLGKRLGGWTKVAVSAAERSWDGKRVRKFDADELVAIASALGVPVVALLLPPSDAGTAVDYIFTAGSAPVPPIDAVGMFAHLSTAGEGDAPVMKAFRERVMALGASGLFPVADQVIADARREADETLGRARREADEILGKVRDHAMQITGDARGRAESLERDAIERHRQAMGSLVPQREELERRIDDLRAFEREYRSRLLAYLEGQVRDLRAGAADYGTFPAVAPPRG